MELPHLSLFVFKCILYNILQSVSQDHLNYLSLPGTPMYKRQISAMGGVEIIGLLLFGGRILVPATAFSVVLRVFGLFFEVFL